MLNIGLAESIKRLCCCFLLLSTTVVMAFTGRVERSVEQMYDEDDLSACELFAGGFINFGYWNVPLKDGVISIEERIASEKRLYRHVVQNLNIEKNHRLLEVGCGQGVGCCLVMQEYAPFQIYGMDVSSAQVERAYQVNSRFLSKHPDSLFFLVGKAERIPYGSSTFEGVFSVEAAQHFENLEQFF